MIEVTIGGGMRVVYHVRDVSLDATAGGLVGSVGQLTLIDGGTVSVPSNAVYGPDCRWAPENEGVAPDIKVGGPSNRSEFQQGKGHPRPGVSMVDFRHLLVLKFWEYRRACVSTSQGRSWG